MNDYPSEYDAPDFCEVCGPGDNCQCPECPMCLETGRLACFIEHKLLLPDGSTPAVMWHGNPGIENHGCWVCLEILRGQEEPHIPEETPQEKAGMVQCRGCSAWGWTVFCAKCAEAGKADCAHGKSPGECDACDRLADLAFDAARESR